MKPTFSKGLSLLMITTMFITTGCTKQQSSKKAYPADKPNILIVVPDDMGWSDAGYHGSEIKTPSIDKLAREGIRLHQHYVMPTCTPTRVSLLTGRYPSRYGITGPAYGEVIDEGDETLASLLGKNGYYTAIAGKWHMGSPPYTPLKYGFQSTYGYFDGQIDPYTHEYKKETALTDRKSWHRNDVYLEEEGHATDLITEEAIRVIELERKRPFFLFVAYSVPHYPLDEPEKWTSVYDDYSLFPSREWFAASVTHMDNGIGKIMDALKRTGQLENTLVLFLSDNGGQKSWHSETEYQGKYADKPHRVLGNNFPLRGWKGELYEGGIRVPAFIYWPGHLEPRLIEQPIHVSDWLPTLLDVAEAEHGREQLNLDGQSLWPFLTGEQQEPEQHPLYWKTGQAFAVRDSAWKLIVHRNSGQEELYNLEEDFRESRDLSVSYPEKKEALLELLEEFKLKDRE